MSFPYPRYSQDFDLSVCKYIEEGGLGNLYHMWWCHVMSCGQNVARYMKGSAQQRILRSFPVMPLQGLVARTLVSQHQQSSLFGITQLVINTELNSVYFLFAYDVTIYDTTMWLDLPGLSPLYFILAAVQILEVTTSTLPWPRIPAHAYYSYS